MSVLHKDVLFHWLSAKMFNQMSFDQMTQYLKFVPNVGKYKDIRNKSTLGKYRRDRTRARTLCCFGLFFPSFEHAKNLLIMGPNRPKNSSLKCDFLLINYE